MTWHSLARSFASRTAGSLLIENTSASTFGFGSPIAGERPIADGGVTLVLHQLERPGADRLLVDQLGLALLQQRIGVFLRLDRGEVHRQIGQERRLRLRQREAHRILVDSTSIDASSLLKLMSLK